MRAVKRIALFVLVNLLIVMTISIVTSVLGLQPYLQANGINYNALMVFCVIWGFGGAFISLAISRKIAKWTMGVQVIDPNTSDYRARALVQRVYGLARRAGLTVMPEVGIYEGNELNAFATGPTRNRSLVAVSTGLLNRMSEHEVDGVLAHEVAHIANGDMVTMTLVQGVVNAFVMFLARIAGFALSNAVDEEKRPMVRMFATIAAEMVLGLLGVVVVAAFSRYREFRADEGGAKLGGKANMIAALKALKANYHIEAPEEEGQSAIAAFKISGKRGGLLRLFATHPDLDDRIERLERMRAV
jgi:heat shock protein HtpX